MIRVSGYILSIYLALSPVYWLPGMDIQALRALKLGLAASGVMIVWLSAMMNDNIQFPKGLLGPLGFFAVLVFSASALFQASTEESVERLIDIVLGFAFLWSFYLHAQCGGNTLRMLRFAAIGVACLAALATLSFVGKAPGWRAPEEYHFQSLWMAGFGSLRTSWSIGLSLFVPILMIVDIKERSPFKSLRIVGATTLVLFIVSSQLLCAGRAGLLASVLLLMMCFYSYFGKRGAAFIILAGIMAVFLSQDYMMEQLRIAPRLQSLINFAALDRVSAGRLSGYAYAADLIAARPFLGHGFGNVSLLEAVGYEDVHNLWMRLAVEGGVMLPLTFLAVVVASFRLAMRGLRRDQRIEEKIGSHSSTHRQMLAYVIVAGLVASMFEPNVLLGSFQYSAVWWAAVGLAISEKFGSKPPRSQKAQGQIRFSRAVRWGHADI